jgi:nitrite reductase/ring-hydroxylating ferredoxin subunit
VTTSGPHTICAFGELANPGSRAFSVGEGPWPLRGFVVRVDDQVFGYLNRCPHAGHPLNWRPDEFLTPDGRTIMCRSHAAQFERATGECIAGPCAGQALRALPVRLENGFVILDPITLSDYD